MDNNILVGDSLIEDSNFAYLEHGFTWQSAFPDVFEEGGFDVVLGNPPYVRMEFLKKIKPYLEKRFEVASDRADLYCYFFERGLKLLKPNGRLGFISSSTFFKTGSGKPLRDFLRQNATIETIVDFGDIQIFEGVTTYPAILTMQSMLPQKKHEIAFWNIDKLPEANFRATFATNKESYPQSALSSGSWELENPQLKALRDKIIKGKKSLKEVYGSPLYGIKTGLNEAFVIDTAVKNRLCAEDPRSAELLKPFLEGKDFKRWRAESRSLWIIYIPKNRLCIKEYPAIQNWLNNFREQLEKRVTKQAWFELQQPQEAYIKALEGGKISYGHFQKHPIFGYDRNCFYSNNKSYFIPTCDIALLSYLNSNVLWFDFTSRTTAVRGGFYEATAQHVEKLPIPKATYAQKAELAVLAEACQKAAEARYKLEQGFARRIPDLCPPEREARLSNKLKNWWEFADFAAFQKEIKKQFKAEIELEQRNAWEDWMLRDRSEIARLTADIQANEDKINAIIYQLFNLTDEEIKLLEANI